MIKVSPVPLWYRLSKESQLALKLYQWLEYELELEIPHYIGEGSLWQPLKPRITTEEAGREMRRAPSRQARLK